jgi:hypothetical protein
VLEISDMGNLTLNKIESAVRTNDCFCFPGLLELDNSRFVMDDENLRSKLLADKFALVGNSFENILFKVIEPICLDSAVHGDNNV